MHHDNAQNHQGEAGAKDRPEHGIARNVGVERRHDEIDDAGKNEWQKRQHHGGETALGGERANLGSHLRPFTDDPRQAVQDFRQVSAHLHLDHHRHGHESQVTQPDPARHVRQCVIKTETIGHLIDDQAEFRRDRIAHFPRHHADRRHDRMSRSQASNDNIDGVGKLRRHPFPARPTLEQQDHQRHQQPDDGRSNAGNKPGPGDRHQNQSSETGKRAHDDGDSRRRAPHAGFARPATGTIPPGCARDRRSATGARAAGAPSLPLVCRRRRASAAGGLARKLRCPAGSAGRTFPHQQQYAEKDRAIEQIGDVDGHDRL